MSVSMPCVPRCTAKLLKVGGLDPKSRAPGMMTSETCAIATRCCDVRTMASLNEIDSLELLVIVDNEVDPISSYQHPDLKVSGLLADVALRAPLPEGSRGGSKFEIRLDNVCCGAHGLSLMIVRIS